MDLEVVEGKLCGEYLEAIALLYGAHDPKYADSGFLETKFNSNPAGPALHVWARQDGVLVGHCCLIPSLGMREGKIGKIGKPEAFAVLPEARHLLDTKGMHIGLAIPSRLYREAFERGYDWLHAWSTEDALRIHKFCGFKILSFPCTRWVQVIRPAGINKNRTEHRAWLFAALAAFSKVQSLAWRFLLRPFLKPGPPLQTLPDLEGVFHGEPRQGDGGAWGLCLTREVLAWYQASGIRSVTLANGAWLLYFRGGDAAEIVAMDPKAGLFSRLFLLARLRSLMEQEGLPFLLWQGYATSLAGLPVVTALFAGFLPSRHRLFVGIYSSDGAVPPPGHLAFSPFFYATY